MITTNNQSLTNCTYRISDLTQVKMKMLNWLKQFNIFCLLDNQHYADPYSAYECLAAAGANTAFNSEDWDTLNSLAAGSGNWLFGHLSYLFKDHPEAKAKALIDPVGFPPSFFFIPEVVLSIKNNQITIWADNPDEIWNQLILTGEDMSYTHCSVPLKSRFSKQEYLEQIRKLQKHIQRGDCYEINFCQEFFAEGVTIDPFTTYKRLMEVSPNPFSAFYRLHDKYLLCASPERFLKRDGTRVLSQPIKGTIRRNLDDPEKDQLLRQQLAESGKDRSENVMVVDLVRNDLSKICREGSVQVDELYGIYTFPQVHQMISTISGELKASLPFSAILEATFPMGSMTGAPKLKVMELIDRYEHPVRGLFSGSLGYFTPDGNFDFNVVIRSILYNAKEGYISCPAGSGITIYSQPEKEWEECLLKAAAMKKVLEAE